ncbi:MAG: sigma-54-dependent Fis family transcriptional regulator [Candidatus Delongbacteria bacterium]|nr:sigma-54-dependent Fis family transcriptional regulator [Candidatus Delongbacteria bacterium]MBN2836283.1 sigma-54-dependent Fis family transcriptional regulator [Candidatus Delongbacteria bacterium]
MSSVMIVDDEKSIRFTLGEFLKAEGFNVFEAEESESAMNILRSNKIDIIVTDIYMPKESGLDFLKKIKILDSNIIVILITGSPSLESATAAIRDSAFDYLVKPVKKEEIVDCVKRAVSFRSLREQDDQLRNFSTTVDLKFSDNFKKIITRNEKLKSIFKYLEAISNTKEPLLIVGETGVGKELFAESFYRSTCRKGEFVKVNIAGVDDQIFSDMLFGHKKGAFTDAFSNRDGLVKKAKDGVIFLDEIGDLSLQSQVKLLRLIQEGEYYPLGSDKPEYTNSLIVTATNHNLNKLQQDGLFRKDLYYRINTHKIIIPPLRERENDLPLLIDYFFQVVSDELGKPMPKVPVDLYKILDAYSFPGNVRELKAMIYNLISSHGNYKLSLKSIYDHINFIEYSETGKKEDRNDEESIIFPKKLPKYEEILDDLLDEALRRSHGNQRLAASMLGITRQAVNKRLNSRKFIR